LHGEKSPFQNTLYMNFTAIQPIFADKFRLMKVNVEFKCNRANRTTTVQQPATTYNKRTTINGSICAAITFPTIYHSCVSRFLPTSH
jgi:hypothetical protein